MTQSGDEIVVDGQVLLDRIPQHCLSVERDGLETWKLTHYALLTRPAKGWTTREFLTGASHPADCRETDVRQGPAGCIAGPQRVIENSRGVRGGSAI